MTCADSHAHASAPCRNTCACNCSIHIRQLYSLRLAPQYPIIVCVFWFSISGWIDNSPDAGGYIAFCKLTSGLHDSCSVKCSLRIFDDFTWTLFYYVGRWSLTRPHCLQIFQPFWTQVCVHVCLNLPLVCACVVCYMPSSYVLQHPECQKWWRGLTQRNCAVATLMLSMRACTLPAKDISWTLQVGYQCLS